MAEMVKESSEVSVTQKVSNKRKKIEIADPEKEPAVAFETVAVEVKAVNESMTKTPLAKRR